LILVFFASFPIDKILILRYNILNIRQKPGYAAEAAGSFQCIQWMSEGVCFPVETVAFLF